LFKPCYKNHILPLFLLMVVVCFVGHNFLKNANLSISKNPRARSISSTQVQACKDILRTLVSEGSAPHCAVSASNVLLLYSSTDLPPSLIQPASIFPAEIASVKAPRAPPSISWHCLGCFVVASVDDASRHRQRTLFRV